MKLALNTYVYEVAKWPIEKTIESAARLGFNYTEYAACGSGDPTRMPASAARSFSWRMSSTWPARMRAHAARCSTT